MRLYAFLLFVLFAHAASAASITDKASTIVEKKLDIPQEEKDKLPEITTSYQEQVDQTNVINDVEDNKLRTKPAEIPVEVQNVKQGLRTSDESEEIIRPAVDLRNPGPPQRQEHETQNPEFYADEQDFAQAYKKNLNDAQMFLKQGFQGVSDGIQNMFENNEHAKVIQDTIQKLREGFVSQINKFNGTVQSYLHADKTNNISPDNQQTKANIQIIETGLNKIKDDFNKGLKTLSEGVEVMSSVRAQNEKQEPSQPASGGSSQTTNSPPAGPVNGVMTFFANLQNNFQNGLNNITNNLNNFVSMGQNAFRPGQQTSTAAPVAGQPTGVQADPPQGVFQNNFLQQLQIFQSSVSQIIQQYLPMFSQATTPTTPIKQPSEPAQAQTDKPNDPVALDDQGSLVTQAAPVTQAVPVTQPGPIRQLLQNNPISQGIAATVQRFQNINNPEKPRHPEQEKLVSEMLLSEDKKKGHSQGSGDNNNSNDSSGSRLSQSEPSNEIHKDALPEVEMQEQKSEEKTE